MPSPLPSISLILHGEQGTALLPDADRALQEVTGDYEILLVGADPDGVPADNPRVRSVPCAAPEQYAAVLRDGLAASRGDLIAVVDGTVGLEALAPLAAVATHYPVVAGYRLIRDDGLAVRAADRVYNGLVRLLLDTGVRDCHCGLTVFHRQALADSLPESDGPFAPAETFARARRCGLTVVEVPVKGPAATCRPAGLRFGFITPLSPVLGGEGLGVRGPASREATPPLTPSPSPPSTGERGGLGLGGLAAALAACLRFWWCRVQFRGAGPSAARQRGAAWGLLPLALAGLLLFCGLGRQPLLDPDEGRQADVPRQMLTHNDLLVPRVQDQPYFEKPPLQYWLIAASYSQFGVSPWAARLVPASAAWLTLLVAFLWARQSLGTRPAVLGGLVLCLTMGFVLLGRTVLLDSLLTACVVTSWFTAYTATAGGGLRRGWWLASALACGLGLLAKGPVSIALLLPPVLACQALTSRPRWRAWAAYLGVAVAVAAPWYVGMALREPDYLRHFLWRSNVLRYVRPFDHSQPWWYYLPVLLAGTFPWSLLWPGLLYFLASRSPRLGVLRPPAVGFCALAAGWCVLFFTASGSKSPPYLLPALVPLALLLGVCLDAALFRQAWRQGPFLELLRKSWPRWATLGALLVAAGFSLAVTFPGWQRPEEGFVKAGLALAGAAAWACFAWRLRTAAVWAGCAAACLAMIAVAVGDVMKGYSLRHTPSAVAGWIRGRPVGDDTPLITFGRTWPSASFYFRRNYVKFFDGTQVEPLIEYLGTQPEALVLVEDGPLLNGLRHALPARFQPVVYHPSRKGQVALVVVRQREGVTGGASADGER